MPLTEAQKEQLRDWYDRFYEVRDKLNKEHPDASIEELAVMTEEKIGPKPTFF